MTQAYPSKGAPAPSDVGPFDERLAAESIGTLKYFLKRAPNAGIAFSGGKDSIVAAHLAVQLGVTLAVRETSFNFPTADREYRESGEALGLDVREECSLSLRWLTRYPRWICGPVSQLGQFYAQRQQKTVQDFANAQLLDGMIFGRRTQENTVATEVYLKGGVWQCHPLRDWRTEDVWAYVYEHDLPFSGIYRHQVGDYSGAAPWNTLSRDWLERVSGGRDTPESLIADYESPEFLKSIEPVLAVGR